MAKHKTQELSSHSAGCAIDQREGDDVDASSSSHLNKFKMGLFSVVNKKQHFWKKNRETPPGKKTHTKILPRTEYLASRVCNAPAKDFFMNFKNNDKELSRQKGKHDVNRKYTTEIREKLPGNLDTNCTF